MRVFECTLRERERTHCLFLSVVAMFIVSLSHFVCAALPVSHTCFFSLELPKYSKVSDSSPALCCVSVFCYCCVHVLIVCSLCVPCTERSNARANAVRNQKLPFHRHGVYCSCVFLLRCHVSVSSSSRVVSLSRVCSCVCCVCRTSCQQKMSTGRLIKAAWLLLWLWNVCVTVTKKLTAKSLIFWCNWVHFCTFWHNFHLNFHFSLRITSFHHLDKPPKGSIKIIVFHLHDLPTVCLFLLHIQVWFWFYYCSFIISAIQSAYLPRLLIFVKAVCSWTNTTNNAMLCWFIAFSIWFNRNCCSVHVFVVAN